MNPAGTWGEGDAQRTSTSGGGSTDLLETTAGAPHARDTANLRRIANRTLLALAPCAAMVLYNSGWRAEPVVSFVAVLIAVVAWHRMLAPAERRESAPELVLTAALFTICLPVALPPWQAVVGVSFGVVLAKEVFGGVGRNFVHPVTAGLAFLYFAYPSSFRPGTDTVTARVSDGGLDALESGFGWTDAALGRMAEGAGSASLLACAVGAAILVHGRVASWRIMAGGLAGALLTSLVSMAVGGGPLAAVPWHWHLAFGGITFGLVFLATDPTTAAITQPGRVVYGIFVGALAVLLRTAESTHAHAWFLAILLGNICAPLVDHGVCAWNRRTRRRRHA